MKHFFCGLAVGVVSGVAIGVVLSACGVFFVGQIMQKQQAAASQVTDKIDQNAGDLAGKYPSDAQIAELANIYLSERQNYGLVIGVLSNGSTKISGFGKISKKLT
jgi:hypothetical protein